MHCSISYYMYVEVLFLQQVEAPENMEAPITTSHALCVCLGIDLAVMNS
jgi:hypothetical protein